MADSVAGDVVPLKANVDEALNKTDRVKKVVVLQRVGNPPDKLPRDPVNWVEGRDVWWHELIRDQSTDCPAEPMDAEDMLFVLYTSGSTGKPKGIIHTTGGYLAGVYVTTKYVFDHQARRCLLVLGRRRLDHRPQLCRLWPAGQRRDHADVRRRAQFPRFQPILVDDRAAPRDASFTPRPPPSAPSCAPAASWWISTTSQSLRLLGTVGEPINPEAWMWYREVIGDERCPIVDTWWQTETGAIMITPLPGATPTKPGTATLPFFGVDAAIVDRSGKELGPNQGGLLVIRKPWPSMLRGIFNDPDRYVKQYWTEVPAYYFTGDGARRDADGYFWIMGRVDDVINVSGHRLGTMEIESALVAHEAVAEAAVVGMPHEMKGQGIAAFVTLANDFQPTEKLKKELIDWVGKQIGSIASPDQIRFTAPSPKPAAAKSCAACSRNSPPAAK